MTMLRSGRDPDPEMTARRDALLLAALPHVAFDGWSRRTLTAAALDAGLDHDAVEELFPAGVPDLVRHLSDWADREMAARLRDEAETVAEMRLRERVAFAILARLEALEPWKEAARRAAAVGILSPRAGTGRATLVTADRIWRALGDRSTDYNWYSKRLLLAGVLTATFLFWLDDDGSDPERLPGFVARRIDEVIRVGGAGGRAARFAGRVAEAPFHIAGRLTAWLRPSG